MILTYAIIDGVEDCFASSALAAEKPKLNGSPLRFFANQLNILTVVDHEVTYIR